MSINPLDAALISYLKAKNSLYFGKIQELREVLQGWLAYIPQTFPHYTRHTIEHSDEIVLQLSKVLFEEEDPSRPCVSLSGIEAYILITAAYLHDAGMVSSDTEKMKIVSSESWRSWTQGEGGGAKRWMEVDALRKGPTPSDSTLRNFLADVQTRFLIAEFIRRRHHIRGGEVITQHQTTLGRFAFDDQQLQDAIANVCVGHGLHAHELEDVHKYPERRDIRGEPVNLRFIAILLRLGDLLDMSCDRACPLLTNAASPVPSESFAHWSQYRRIAHRLTAPDRIEISAFCVNQDEHRIIQDWCQWLTDEVKNAGIVMGSSPRHGGWKPPHVSLSEPNQTIRIRPAEEATYIPSQWSLELDRGAIMERLVYNVHNRADLFIRELIQNALDATRSKMYGDLIAQGHEPPAYPTEAAEEFRSSYPIKISLREKVVSNELSGESEKVQILSVEDQGIGMNRDIIERYFLQIGRSYYTSEEYRRTCKFNPISRFGVGFLSVFAVSDYVVVETYRPVAENDLGAVRITLTGPRNYLLVDKGARRTSGTKIDVWLRNPFGQGELPKLVAAWCRKVEFPVLVDDFGEVVAVEADKPEQFTYEMPDLTEDGARFVVRSFEIKRSPIDGDLFVFAHMGKNGERWDRSHWARNKYPSMHPQASMPPFVPNLYCFHGLSDSDDYRRFQHGSTIATRVDYRGANPEENMSRQRTDQRGTWSPLDLNSIREIDKRWEEILTEHLSSAPCARSENAWKYKQNLVSEFPLDSFWRTLPAMIPLYQKGDKAILDLQSVVELETLRVVMPDSFDSLYSQVAEEEWNDIATLTNTDTPTMVFQELNHLSEKHRRDIFGNKVLTSINRSPSGAFEIYWRIGNRSPEFNFQNDANWQVDVVEYAGDSIVGGKLHKTTGSVYAHTFLNLNHPFVKWLLRLKENAQKSASPIDLTRFRTVVSLLKTPLSHSGYENEKLGNYVNKWNEIPGLEAELHPPEMCFSRDLFHL